MMIAGQNLDMKTSLFCIGRSAVNWNDLLSRKGDLVAHPFPNFALAADQPRKWWMDWLVNVI